MEKKYGFTSIIYEVAKKRGPQPKSKVQGLVICYVTERYRTGPHVVVKGTTFADTAA